MGIIELIFLSIIVVTLGMSSIPLYAMYRGYNQSDAKLKLRQIKEERALEELKQENYLLENKQMRLELDKIKEDRKKKEDQKSESSHWLVEDTEERAEDD